MNTIKEYERKLRELAWTNAAAAWEAANAPASPAGAKVRARALTEYARSLDKGAK